MEAGSKLPSLSLAPSKFQLVEKRRPSAEGKTHRDIASFIHPLDKHSSDHMLGGLMLSQRKKTSEEIPDRRQGAEALTDAQEGTDEDHSSGTNPALRGQGRL